MNNFSLDTITIYPENKNSIKKAIILFHGYGGDGKDISMLSYNWTRHLENTIILCPNAHQKCSINPLGYQWFDLSNDDESFVINQTGTTLGTSGHSALFRVNNTSGKIIFNAEL